MLNAEIDYKSSAPLNETECMGLERVPITDTLHTYKTRAALSRFTKLHCPPIGTSPKVDDVWQEIIEHYVNPDDIQFLPIRLKARDGETLKFKMIIPLVGMELIDVQASKIRSKTIGLDGSLIVFDVDEFSYLPNCLLGKHLAMDKHLSGHIVISDELRNALAETGEDSMFFRAEDIPTMFGKNSIFEH
jgi:hypothetical protein